MQSIVIVRAFAGEPLRRVVVEATPTRVYVANPALLDKVASGESDPVGVSRADVFEFEGGALDRLLTEYRERGETASESWRGMQTWAGASNVRI